MFFSYVFLFAPRKNFELFIFLEFIYLFIFGCVWVFVAARGLSLVMVSGGYFSLQCTGFSLQWLLLLWSMGSVVAACGLYSAGSVVVVHRLSCSVAYGIFPDQGSNTCLLHWQADS